MMYEKALQKYGSYSNVGKIFKIHIVDRMKKIEKIPYLFTVFKICDIEKEIGYTFEDFCNDYPSVISKYKFPKFYYNICKKGMSISQYSKAKGISDGVIYKLFMHGCDKTTEEMKVILSDILEIEFSKDDLNIFEVVVEEDYCKLIGLEEELEVFKKKYNIDYPVLPLGQKFHLAFDGSIFNKISEIIK